MPGEVIRLELCSRISHQPQKEIFKKNDTKEKICKPTNHYLVCLETVSAYEQYYFHHRGEKLPLRCEQYEAKDIASTLWTHRSPPVIPLIYSRGSFSWKI